MPLLVVGAAIERSLNRRSISQNVFDEVAPLISSVIDRGKVKRTTTILFLGGRYGAPLLLHLLRSEVMSLVRR